MCSATSSTTKPAKRSRPAHPLHDPPSIHPDRRVEAESGALLDMWTASAGAISSLEGSPPARRWSRRGGSMRGAVAPSASAARRALSPAVPAPEWRRPPRTVVSCLGALWFDGAGPSVGGGAASPRGPCRRAPGGPLDHQHQRRRRDHRPAQQHVPAGHHPEQGESRRTPHRRHVARGRDPRRTILLVGAGPAAAPRRPARPPPGARARGRGTAATATHHEGQAPEPARDAILEAQHHGRGGPGRQRRAGVGGGPQPTPTRATSPGLPTARSGPSRMAQPVQPRQPEDPCGRSCSPPQRQGREEAIPTGCSRPSGLRSARSGPWLRW